ncbi:hypothetical protein [Saccharomonospora piscinae]|uniref:hypothetical protein n=1 Tax=Saccharomonospora piscinae TaxID=687388 RepID=UPI0012DE6EE3|nr:hypothetical protein [Saccharomonospora piscinae]
MADHGRPARPADRVRVTRTAQRRRMADHRRPARPADRVRVTRKTKEAAHG